MCIYYGYIASRNWQQVLKQPVYSECRIASRIRCIKNTTHNTRLTTHRVCQLVLIVNDRMAALSRLAKSVLEETQHGIESNAHARLLRLFIHAGDEMVLL